MNKLAYEYGALSALRALYKKADEEDSQMKENTPAANPAELIAQVFQEGVVNHVDPTPDNKTKKDKADPYGGEPHWGKNVDGHGGESLERNAPGFHMPMISGV